MLGRTITDEADIFAAEQDLLNQANAGEAASDELDRSYEALGSEARFDRVLFDGGEFGHAGEVHVGSEEEMDFLGIPGLLEPARCASCSSSARATGPRSRSRRPRVSRTRCPRCPPTSSSPCCGAS